MNQISTDVGRARLIAENHGAFHVNRTLAQLDIFQKLARLYNEVLVQE